MGTKTITPRVHNDGQIGSSSKYWNKGYFNELNANTLNLTTLELSGTLAVSEGGTGAGTHTSNSILVGDGTNSIKSYTDLRYYSTTETLKIGDLDNGAATIERNAGFASPLGDLDIKAPIPQVGSTNFSGGNLNLHAGASSGNGSGGSIQFWAATAGASGTTIRNTIVVGAFNKNGLYLSQNSVIVFEGPLDDAHETTVTVANPTADRTITFPDATGTVALTSGIPTVPDDTVSTGTHIHTQTKVTLSQANCNALSVSPRILVAAQGADTIIVPVSVTVLADRNSADSSGCDLIVGYNNTTSYQYALRYLRRFMLGISTDMQFNMAPYFAGHGANSLTGGTNVPLTISTSAPMSTNSLNSMVIYTSYYVIDLT